jgi:hypothetical protein
MYVPALAATQVITTLIQEIANVNTSVTLFRRFFRLTCV